MKLGKLFITSCFLLSSAFSMESLKEENPNRDKLIKEFKEEIKNKGYGNNSSCSSKALEIIPLLNDVSKETENFWGNFLENFYQEELSKKSPSSKLVTALLKTEETKNIIGNINQKLLWNILEESLKKGEFHDTLKAPALAYEILDKYLDLTPDYINVLRKIFINSDSFNKDYIRFDFLPILVKRDIININDKQLVTKLPFNEIVFLIPILNEKNFFNFEKDDDKLMLRDIFRKSITEKYENTSSYILNNFGNKILTKNELKTMWNGNPESKLVKEALQVAYGEEKLPELEEDIL